MDEESRTPKDLENKKESQQDRISQVSIYQQNSSNKSSRRNRRSLIQVMSVQDNDQNDSIYQYYLIDDVKDSIKRKSNRSYNSRVGSSAENSLQPEIQQIIKRRSSTSRMIQHECRCDDDNCIGHLCQCYNCVQEVCAQENCCYNCVRLKKQRVLHRQSSMNDISRPKAVKITAQNCTCSSIIKASSDQSHVPSCPANENYAKSVKNLKAKGVVPFKSHNNVHNHAGCSCKKSHCLKKYCACFANGQKCSSGCQCLDCMNNLLQDEQTLRKRIQLTKETRQNQHEQEDIDKYIQDQNYQNRLMPSSMEFETPNLTYSFDH